MPKLPYLYFAFAHDPEDPLPNLRQEGEQLYQMLLQRKQHGHFDIHRDEFAAIEVISKNLRTFKDQVIVFHYGGHAASKSLFLNDQEANADGIAELLGHQKNLKLVFLNGCSTQAQVEYLKLLGIPAVIATSRPIKDILATKFAGEFYDALVKNFTLKEAFDLAASCLKAAQVPVSCIRGIKLEREVGTDTWILSVADEAHYSWKLPRELLPDPDSKFGHTLSLPSIVPEIFLGREDDLLRIHDKLFATGGNMLLLNGEGGLGKTSLAARYFDRYKAEYAHVAWVTSNGNLADAVLTLAAPLGLTEEESFLRLDTSQRIEKLLNAMSNLPRPCLLVVDNANELEDLKAYYPQLQRCSNFHMLFTTRISKYGTAVFLGVTPLPEDLALQAFRTHYEAFEPYEEPHFRELYQAVGGNTLVLEVFARLLGKLNSDLEKHYTLEELVDDVEKGLLQPGQNAVVVEVRYQSLQEATPEKILGAMYKISDLDTKEAALLAVFAALPPERIAFDDLKMLLQQEALDALLLSLAQRGWLDFAREVRAFRCSPVVQAAVRRQHGNWKADCGALVQGLAHGLDPEIIHEDNFQRSTLYARYAETVTAVLDTPDYDLARLCHNLGNFHTVTGDLVKALQAFVQMERLSAALMEGSPEIGYFKNGLAISYSKLGETHAALGNLQQALIFFEQYNLLEKALYEAFPNNVEFKNNLAISYIQVGWLYETKKQDIPQARNHYQKSLGLLKELVSSNPDYPEFKENLDWIEQKLKEIKK